MPQLRHFPDLSQFWLPLETVYHREDKCKPEGWDLPVIPPLCADRKQAVWFTDKNKKSPLMFVSKPAWNSVQTGYAAPYWGSSLKGNGSENLDVFKRQRGLQGHHTFLIRLTLRSQFKRDTITFSIRPKDGKANSFIRCQSQVSPHIFFFSICQMWICCLRGTSCHSSAPLTLQYFQWQLF